MVLNVKPISEMDGCYHTRTAAILGLVAQSAAKCLVGDWADYTMHNVHLATSLTFFWRPELWHESDHALFANKLCSHPPDLLVIGKGVHDAVFKSSDFSDQDAVFKRLCRLGRDLQCLPVSTLIILLTPTFDDLHPSSSTEFKARHNIAATLIRAEAYLQGDVRRHTLILDRYQLTRSYSSGGDTGTRHSSQDGMHYPAIVNELIRDQIVTVFELRADIAFASHLGRGRDETTTTPSKPLV